MARVAVVGAGSVGAYFAAQLSVTEHDVIACVRRPFEEYVIDSRTTPLRAPATVVTSPDQLDGPADWVLVGVKAHQTAGAAPWFDTVCATSTRVVALQNGVEAVERLTPLVHGAEVLPTVVYCGTELVAPGHVHHVTQQRLIVPDTPTGRALRSLYDATPVEIRPDADYPTKAWLKLAINVVGNGLTALTGRPMEVLAEPTLFPVATAMLAETWSVANAEGARIDASDPAGFISAISANNEGGRTSMLHDVEAGRPTEHDAIHGAVIRAADRHGIDVPTVRAIHGILDARAR